MADIRNFNAATTVYLKESTAFLKDKMEKTGVEYNTDIENLKLPFQDETLSYAFTQLITQLLQYEKSLGFLQENTNEFDRQTAIQLDLAFNEEADNRIRNKTLNEIVENIESLVEEKNGMIQLTIEIEKTIKQLEIKLSTFFN